jgi:hypothetical protein
MLWLRFQIESTSFARIASVSKVDAVGGEADFASLYTGGRGKGLRQNKVSRLID